MIDAARPSKAEFVTTQTLRRDNQDAHCAQANANKIHINAPKRQ
jgi:hypothetical protein